jgi:anion-transporting  ArsA/GET3 family ATPase
MLLEKILKRRFVILSGKGGVGKSLVGAALALAASLRGKRVLLAEIDAPRDASQYLDIPALGARQTEVLPRLFAVNLDPRLVMDEYIRHAVKVDLIARRILKSPVYHRFFAAAPGLKELMALGKLMVLEEEREGVRRRPRYDLILLDAPATGHGLSLLKVPQTAAKAIPVGPIGANARRILALLRDPRRTALVLVATPEEMAVVEAIEFHRMAVEELGIVPTALVLNAVHERRFSPEQEAAVRRLQATVVGGRLAPDVPLAAALVAAGRHLRRHRLSRFYEARLKRSLSLPVVRLPYLFSERLGREEVRLLADRLASA